VLPPNGILSALEVAPLGHFHGTAYRLIEHRYIETALSGIGSLTAGGRYNVAGAFEALYLSEDPTTTLHEAQAVVHTDGRLIGVKGPPRLLLSIELELKHVLDVTSETLHAQLRTTLPELISSWLPFVGCTPPAPTQELGSAAYATGRISALRAPSARVPGATNIIVFPDRLRVGEFVAVFDDTGNIRARLDGS
jgi:RES domain-containing protein